MIFFLDTNRIGKRQHGGLPKRCVYLRNTASGCEVPVLQWINIDEVSACLNTQDNMSFNAHLLSNKFIFQWLIQSTRKVMFLSW